MNDNMADVLKQNFELRAENRQLKSEIVQLKGNISLAQSKIATYNIQLKMQAEKYDNLEKNMKSIIADKVQKAKNMTTQNLTAHYEAEIRKLNKQIEQLEAKEK